MANWKEIKGYEGLYLISDEGQVLSLSRRVFSDFFRAGRDVAEKILTPIRTCTYTSSRYGAAGYPAVRLCNAKHEKRTHHIHRLVAEAFLERPEGCNFVNHKDHNGWNNRVENLEWCTQPYNNEYSNNKAVKQYTPAGSLLAEYESIKQASEKTGVYATNISMCINGHRTIAGGFVWKLA